MPKIAPCLMVDTEGEEAARFYTSVFPNSRITDVLATARPGRARRARWRSAFSLDGED